MAKYKIERTYLVRKVQTWEFESPLSEDELEAWREADFAAFDESVCDFGTLLDSSTHTLVDNDDLQTYVLHPTS